jgi:hypothetical protein
MPLTGSHYVCPTAIYPLQGQLFSLSVATSGATLSNNGLTTDTLRASAVQCTGDRLAKGVCAVREWARPLPGPYQYFQRPDEANFGGANSLQVRFVLGK